MEVVSALRNHLKEITEILKSECDQFNQECEYNDHKEKLRILFELVKEQMNNENSNHSTR